MLEKKIGNCHFFSELIFLCELHHLNPFNSHKSPWGTGQHPPLCRHREPLRGPPRALLEYVGV